MYFHIEQTTNGYILIDKTKTTKYVLNNSKRAGASNQKFAPYYLKQVAPKEQYISGLYKDKKRNKYNGRYNTTNINFVVKVIFFNTGTAKIEFIPAPAQVKKL